MCSKIVMILLINNIQEIFSLSITIRNGSHMNSHRGLSAIITKSMRLVYTLST